MKVPAGLQKQVSRRYIFGSAFYCEVIDASLVICFHKVMELNLAARASCLRSRTAPQAYRVTPLQLLHTHRVVKHSHKRYLLEIERRHLNRPPA